MNDSEKLGLAFLESEGPLHASGIFVKPSEMKVKEFFKNLFVQMRSEFEKSMIRFVFYGC
jgi:hypothetical protein